MFLVLIDIFRQMINVEFFSIFLNDKRCGSKTYDDIQHISKIKSLDGFIEQDVEVIYLSEKI